MIDQFKLYAGTAVAAVIGLLAIIFKMRGDKIESLKSDNETLKQNSDELTKSIEAQKKEIETREKVQQILTEPDAVFDAADRLRERAKSNSNKS